MTAACDILQPIPFIVIFNDYFQTAVTAVIGIRFQSPATLYDAIFDMRIVTYVHFV